MAPFTNTRSIPRDLSEWFAPQISDRMLSRVRLWRPGGLGVQDPTSGKTPKLAPVSYYEGPARIQARGPVQPATGGSERPVAVGDFLVAVPVSAGEPQLKDTVEILASEDQMLVSAGTVLLVVNVPTADVILERDLGCDRQSNTNRRG